MNKLSFSKAEEIRELYNSNIIFSNEFIINSVSNDGSSKFSRLENHLNLLNDHFKIDSKFLIKTNNNFSIGVGLASSASSYASITYAYFIYNNLSNDLKEISKWARIGSGSATRSLHGGFVKWEKGNSHDDSYGEVVLDNWKEFRVVVVNISKGEKKISSRDAMKKAVLLDEYSSYVNRSVIMYNDLEKALIKKDFSRLGKIAEDNAIMLHDIINKNFEVKLWS